MSHTWTPELAADWNRHHGRTILYRGLRWTVKVSSYSSAYPRDEYRMDVSLECTDRESLEYRTTRRQLGDDWVTDVLDSTPEAYGAVLAAARRAELLETLYSAARAIKDLAGWTCTPGELAEEQITERHNDLGAAHVTRDAIQEQITRIEADMDAEFDARERREAAIEAASAQKPYQTCGRCGQDHGAALCAPATP